MALPGRDHGHLDGMRKNHIDSFDVTTNVFAFTNKSKHTPEEEFTDDVESIPIRVGK